MCTWPTQVTMLFQNVSVMSMTLALDHGAPVLHPAYYYDVSMGYGAEMCGEASIRAATSGCHLSPV